MLTARQLKIIKLIMNNPGIHGKEISAYVSRNNKDFDSRNNFIDRK
jgi:activator of the mannose operon (transcriptional antiterminator)